MSTYAAQLHALVDGIVNWSIDLPISIISLSRTDQFNPTERFAVYADGYEMRLCAAVSADYPVLAHYLGSDVLSVALQDYVRTCPSRQWDLNLYPVGFSTFICQWSDDPVAHALADLESAITHVFWLPDSAPLDPKALAALTMDDLARYQFKPRTALKLVKLNVSADHYLTAFRSGLMPKAIEHTPEYLCIVRHHNEVRRLHLQAHEYFLLSILFEGVAFGAALEQSSATVSESTLASLIAGWLNDGVFRA